MFVKETAKYETCLTGRCSREFLSPISEHDRLVDCESVSMIWNIIDKPSTVSNDRYCHMTEYDSYGIMSKRLQIIFINHYNTLEVAWTASKSKYIIHKFEIQYLSYSLNSTLKNNKFYRFLFLYHSRLIFQIKLFSILISTRI
jgi:hypothetical protein